MNLRLSIGCLTIYQLIYRQQEMDPKIYSLAQNKSPILKATVNRWGRLDIAMVVALVRDKHAAKSASRTGNFKLVAMLTVRVGRLAMKVVSQRSCT